MRVLCISDTHNRHHDLDLTGVNADVLVHCGDFTDRGHMIEVRDFIEWFERQPFPTKILVAGNHELSLDEEWLASTPGFEDIKTNCRHTIRELVRENRNIIYLEDSSCVVDGVKFYGSPRTRWLPQWAFQYKDDEEAERGWSKIPGDTDVLVTHTPPFGIMDECEGGTFVQGGKKSIGCPILYHHSAIRVRPKVHVFGHVHEKHGVFQTRGTKFINCACVNEDHEPISHGTVFEV